MVEVTLLYQKAIYIFCTLFYVVSYNVVETVDRFVCFLHIYSKDVELPINLLLHGVVIAVRLQKWSTQSVMWRAKRDHSLTGKI